MTYLTVAEVAKKLGLEENQVRRLLWNQVIPIAKDDHVLRIPESGVIAYEQKLRKKREREREKNQLDSSRGD